MVRYRVQGEWHDDQVVGEFITQYADALDHKTGTVYTQGAYRVVRRGDRSPAVRGKGGSVPFWGEMAWSQSWNLADDLETKRRYGR
jgi:hypothetical protein